MPLPPMLCHAEQSLLVVVDLQPRLAEAMPETEREQMLTTTAMLIQAAEKLDIPIVVTEQYPQGLGHTCDEIAAVLPPQVRPIAKTGFACTCADPFRQALEASGRTQIILTGQEAHVCVLQTAFALQGAHQVFVVEDAVCSRKPEHKVYALERMRQAGVVVTSGESVLFEWLRDAAHPRFKELARLIR